MDISKYTGYFHDGSIDAIHHHGNELSILMESAEMDPEEGLELSEDNRIKGILTIKEISHITQNEKAIYPLEMLRECGDILDFSIDKNSVSFFIEWINFSAKEESDLYSDIKITGGEILWENNPNG